MAETTPKQNPACVSIRMFIICKDSTFPSKEKNKNTERHFLSFAFCELKKNT